MSTLLAHTLLEPREGGVHKWVVFAHGILGTGSNWRSLAQRWLAVRPGFAAVLVDLRMHGRSGGFAGPHSVAAAAGDLVPLVRRLDAPLGAIVGHSFGAKVALSYLDIAAAQSAPMPDELWIIDAPVGSTAERGGDASPPEQDSPLHVIAQLEAIPRSFPSRQAFIAALEARGLSTALAQWLAMQLQRGDEADGYEFALDLTAIRELITDFSRVDCWPTVMRWHPHIDLHFVLGGRSRALSSDERMRLHAEAEAGRIELAELPEAGHWVHRDDPEGLVELWAEAGA